RPRLPTPTPWGIPCPPPHQRPSSLPRTPAPGGLVDRGSRQVVGVARQRLSGPAIKAKVRSRLAQRRLDAVELRRFDPPGRLLQDSNKVVDFMKPGRVADVAFWTVAGFLVFRGLDADFARHWLEELRRISFPTRPRRIGQLAGGDQSRFGMVS